MRPTGRYLWLAGFVAATRVLELGISRRNSAGATGVVAAPEGFRPIVATHVLLGVAPLIEMAFVRRRPRAQGLWIGLVLAATGLRWWSIASLGRAWNVQALVPDGIEPVTTGPYRWIRHPNYLALIVEFWAIPMAGGAPLSALGLSVLNGYLLAGRIRAEERLLDQSPRYREAFAGRSRLLPWIW